MSIQALEAAGDLERIGDELIEPDERPTRIVFGTEKFIAWREDSLPYLQGNDRSDLIPDEEVDDFLRRFQLGKPLSEIARLMPTADGVWEVRLHQLRLLGWFVQRDCLILAEGEDVDVIKGKGGPSYRSLKSSTEKQRETLGLDYVKGDHRAILGPKAK